MPKAASADQATKQADIPSVDSPIASVVRGLGIATSGQVRCKALLAQAQRGAT